MRVNAVMGGTPKTFQKVSLSSTSARSNQLTNGKIYRIVADADVFLALGGSTKDATTNDTWFLPSGVVDYFECNKNIGDYLAAILASGTGTLYIAEVAS